MTGGPDHGNPVPQGDYVAATRHGALIFTAGMTPRRDGRLMFHGPVRKDQPPETHREAVVLACGNALRAARAMLAPGEGVTAILSMTVHVAAEEGFAAHSALADFASQFLHAQLGSAGIGSRCAVGVATLPGNAPVEIRLVAAAGA